MKLGISLRNSGVAATPELVSSCARLADDAGLESLWVNDHIAIPPDQAEGSGGRYLDPLATLAFAAGVTRSIGLGVGVLVLPYRPPLVTAKWVASLQELSGGRLLLGVGVGWMEAEFRAVGVDRRRRGAISDDTLRFLHRCFEQDEMEANGQRFYFRPRPSRPPIFVGGASHHAFPRVLAYGDGWFPIGLGAEQLAAEVRDLRRRAADADRPRPEVVTFASLPLDDVAASRALLESYRSAGVTRLVHGLRYQEQETFERAVAGLAGLAAAS